MQDLTYYLPVVSESVHILKLKFFHFFHFFSIDVDMKSTILCEAIKNGNEEEWDFAWERYKASNVATEKRSLLGGLSCTKEIWLLNR